MSAVSTYQEAFRSHVAANKIASEVLQEIYNIANAASTDLRSFMGWQFNIQIDSRGGRFDPKAKVDLAKWPNAEQLRTALGAWSEADTALRQAWEAVPEGERVGLTPPPTSMQLAARRY